MGEYSLRLLITKLVPFLTFLLLWQLGFCIEAPGFPGGHDNKEQPSCSQGDTGLPCAEVSALYTVLHSFKEFTMPSIGPSYCDQPSNITCDCNNSTKVCHITEINMTNMGVGGFIHRKVSYLKYLRALVLYDNKLSGSIPDSLGDLRNLTTLDLSSNQLIGPIPQSLGKLQSLTMLDLSSNQLTGPIPKSLGKLQSLTALFLSQNLLSGTIPPSVGDLSSLVYLDISINNLTGKIPTDLAKLSKLEKLYLCENQLYGPLPPELGRLKNLEALQIMSNNFNGTLPGDYSQLTSLQLFAVGGNNLFGPVPNYFNNWVNLSILILLGNNFEGPLHQEIFSMSLQYLWVSDLNSSSFPIPDSANLSNIYFLILRNCSINGSIPKNIGAWSSLTYLDLSFNSLTGGIPDSMKDLKNLEEIYLTGNMLDGDIHRRIYQIKGDLSYNNFTNTGPVKQKIDIEPSRSTVYHMKEKSCNGKKYDSLFINSGGEEETIGKNHYYSDTATTNYYESQEGNWAYSCSGGFIFSEDTANANNYLKNITCGISVPEGNIYTNARLCPISLTYYGFCLREGTYNVQLHFAEIVYAENKDYSSLGKRVFDVYSQGVRKLKDFNIKEKAGGLTNPRVENFTTQVGKGHNNTLTINFFWAGKGSTFNPPGLNGPLISAIAVTLIPGHRKLMAWEIVGITVSSVFALLLLLFALLWRMGLVGNKELYEKKIEIRGKYYSLKQLMEATRNFNPSLEIGRGQFGGVYKAELPDQTVTVKKLSANSKQVIQEIETEVYALKSFKHENLVELLATYCRKGLNLLIYEYMEHKSLKEALFDSHSVVLPWEVRYNICLGVAEGLKYLHGRTPRVIHRNIKASIVLLDGSFKAKISDFGLSKLYEEENPYLVIGIKGTLAYMAPEYATRRAISDKVDVYSFGVLVLEIVSGRDNATYNENQETVFLLDEACVSHTKGRLLNLVDRKLSSYDRVQVLTVLNLAMTCIDQSPTLRPTMSEVVDVLEGNETIEQISKVATPSE